MKTLKLFLVGAVISASSLFTISCGGSEKEANPLADSLSNVNGELSGQLSEKEIALQEFVNSFNEIQENLKAIKEKEKLLQQVLKVVMLKVKRKQLKKIYKLSMIY